ncbi:hypothetical protein OG2516_13551 [Oceanicola granulosus HTCC2516]|uniref:Uncharacterized protein n=1 Tax=Oceanicola granulosus (strain ATCC BAA-861 / DSM 15982 / KCTC 12143 / HTCC2516) TaxID=314256 RepID=Q2CE37_OCEGH|nr:hypothetical protein [Oceanicola granulosus]EAR50901.1 hypothetical protein OG2516_13551 [Oceanicola granulosus HTCC2516]
MRHADLRSLLASDALARGPVALLIAEDEVEVASTLRHHLARGFRSVVLFAPPGLEVPDDLAARIHRVDHDTLEDRALTNIVNPVIAAAPVGTWFYYGYNAEYLFYPFCEYRTVGEATTFVTEERRDTAMCYVVDLYAADLAAHPGAVSIENAHLDKSGYYALVRRDRWNNDIERQMDFFGGLRWRFEEHVPPVRRRIDRVALFRAAKGLKLDEDHTFNIPEYNTYACPWHHSLTAAVCSFRTAKALKRNPGSTFDIPTFWWHNSIRFDWHSQQLLDLGLMEPGQWF